MKKMTAAQVTKPGAPFDLVEREVPQPGPGQVRIRVRACGLCHSDKYVKDNLWPGIQYPRVPGHEVAGVFDDDVNPAQELSGTTPTASGSVGCDAG